MKVSVKIRQAHASEAPFLTELTIRSKAHWGYSEAFMAAAIPELEFHREKFLPEFLVYVLQEDDKRVGFCSLLRMDDTLELHDLFVDPPHIGQGYGKRLWLHSLRVARERGFKRMTITADPNAEPFYVAQGARRIGEKPSLVEHRRSLPVLEYLL